MVIRNKGLGMRNKIAIVIAFPLRGRWAARRQVGKRYQVNSRGSDEVIYWFSFK